MASCLSYFFYKPLHTTLSKVVLIISFILQSKVWSKAERKTQMEQVCMDGMWTISLEQIYTGILCMPFWFID